MLQIRMELRMIRRRQTTRGLYGRICPLHRAEQRCTLVLEMAFRIFAGRNEEKTMYAFECHSGTCARFEVLDEMIESTAVIFSLRLKVEDRSDGHNEYVQELGVEAAFNVEFHG